MDNANSIKPVMIVVAALILAAVIAGSWWMGYKQGAREGLAGGGPANLPPITDIRSVSGTVEEVGDNYVKVKTFVAPGVSSKNLEVRTVEVGADTVIEKMTQKEPAAFSKEMEAFSKKMGTAQPGATPPMPPEPFTRERISLKDIKNGDTITASSKENIIKASKFVAERISVEEAMKTVAPTIPAVPGTVPAGR